jgi:hypothetical protein
MARPLLSRSEVRPVPGVESKTAGRHGVRAVAVGLLIEEQRSEIASAWRAAVERELGGEPAIGFAVGPLLREMALALRADAPAFRPRSGEDALQRCAVLVRSGAQGARVAREFKLLHRAVWDTLKAAGRIVAADERRAVDEWLDEALASSLDRLERVRARVDLLERAPSVVPAARPAPAVSHRPPPLPAARSREAARPPPLPSVPATPYGND